jgi:hypothetical protein
VTALDKTWHTEHFFCAQCGKQFGEDGFHEKDGKAYCKDDYFDMFAPKCGGCNRAIMENYISALNTQWHPDCFVCRVSFGSFESFLLAFFFTGELIKRTARMRLLESLSTQWRASQSAPNALVSRMRTNEHKNNEMMPRNPSQYV